MNSYEELIDLKNRIQESDFGYEEDVQLLDRVLDDYEVKDQQIEELKARVEELEESEKLGIEYEKNAKKCIDYWHAENNALQNQFDMLNKKFIEEMDKTDNLQCQLQALPKQIVDEIKELASNYFEFDICEECGESVHDDVVLQKNVLNKILDSLLKKLEGKMKLTKIENDKIVFDNGAILEYYHDQDCCEHVYADFENMQVLTKINANSLNLDYIDFDENLLAQIDYQKDVGFTIEGTNGIKLFVSCYNRQNGYYSGDLSLVYTDKNKREFKVDISDCVEDDIY